METYEIPDDSKIVAFKYTDFYFDPSYNIFSSIENISYKSQMNEINVINMN